VEQSQLLRGRQIDLEKIWDGLYEKFLASGKWIESSSRLCSSWQDDVVKGRVTLDCDAFMTRPNSSRISCITNEAQSICDRLDRERKEEREKHTDHLTVFGDLIKSLTLRSSFFSSLRHLMSQQEFFQFLPSLVYLDISNCPITKFDLNDLIGCGSHDRSSLTALKYLRMCGCNVTDSDLEQICVGIERERLSLISLDLADNDLTSQVSLHV
jgi:hypothetical protein